MCDHDSECQAVAGGCEPPLKGREVGLGGTVGVGAADHGDNCLRELQVGAGILQIADGGVSVDRDGQERIVRVREFGDGNAALRLPDRFQVASTLWPARIGDPGACRKELVSKFSPRSAAPSQASCRSCATGPLPRRTAGIADAAGRSPAISGHYPSVWGVSPDFSKGVTGASITTVRRGGHR